MTGEVNRKCKGMGMLRKNMAILGEEGVGGDGTNKGKMAIPASSHYISHFFTPGNMPPISFLEKEEKSDGEAREEDSTSGRE